MRGQLSLLALTLIALLLISLVTVVLHHFHEVHNIGSVEVRVMAMAEAVESIKSDLKRILATIISNASRAYAYTEFHNLTVFRVRALRLLERWARVVAVEYGAVVQLNASEHSFTLRGEEYLVPEGFIFKLYWYGPSAFTGGYLEANISIPHLGVYNATARAEVYLYASILNVTSGEGRTRIWLSMLSDSGPISNMTPVYIKVLYPDFTQYGYWREADIVDTEYLGGGAWLVEVKPQVDPVWGVIPLRVYVEDWRGLVASALTYTSIALEVVKNTPDQVVYYDDGYRTIERTSTPDEVYTVELDWRFSLHFLLNEVPLENEAPPPIPPIPVKQLRIYMSRDGSTWGLAPFQAELWEQREWHGQQVWWPRAPADPTYWFNQSCRLVFQVSYPRAEDRVVYVNITWERDCDADIIRWNTSLWYDYRPPEYKDVVSETFRIELIDTEHPVMRDYGFDYHGVAALGFRDPNGTAYGPTNIHSFGTWGSSLGAWRPYGTWRVFHHYSGNYSWAALPVRIFVILNSTKVGNVYTGAVRDDYYDTLAIVYVINGSRYAACLVHVYWESTKTDEGFWMFASMGGGRPAYYMYLKKQETTGWWRSRTYYNVSKEYSYASLWSHAEYEYPNFFCTHWGNGIGRAVFLSRSAVDALYDVGGDPRFAVTKWAPGWIPQHSLEYEFYPVDRAITVRKGTTYSYWFVIYMYSAENRWGEWRKAYIYAPMFLEDYAPSIRVAEVSGVKV